MKALFSRWFSRLPALLRGLGPYVAIELLLPGGSIIALLIWLCRHRMNVAARTSPAGTIACAATAIIEPIAIPSHL